MAARGRLRRRADRQPGRVGGAVERARSTSLGNHTRGHRRQRVGVLPVVEHPRRRGLEHLPRRPVLQRLRRPHLLGRRDVDVSRRCWPSTPSSPPAWTPIASTGCPRPSSTPPPPASPGARFPWESALDGTEQIPPPVSVNSEGLFEQHITADIALAQWQYYLVDRRHGVAGHAGLAGDLRRGGVLGLTRHARRRRQLPHRRRHRSRRGEPRRQRRGVHQRRRQDDAPGRDRGGRCARTDRCRRRGRRSPPGSPCRPPSRAARGSIPSSPATAVSWSSRPT